MNKRFKKIAFALLFVGFLIVVAYRWNYGFWPPRNAHKLVSQISKTKLPADSKIIFFHEGETNFLMDDEYIVALFEVNDRSFFETLYHTGHFKPLTDSTMTQLPIPMNIKKNYFSQRGLKGKFELNSNEKGITSLLLVDESRGYFFLLLEHL